MSATVVQFETSEETIRAFDEIASSRSMTREEALEDLLQAHLAYDKAFRASVEIGIRQANEGRTIPHSEVLAMVDEWEQEADRSERRQ